jgi:hypothetical protein
LFPGGRPLLPAPGKGNLCDCHELFWDGNHALRVHAMTKANAMTRTAVRNMPLRTIHAPLAVAMAVAVFGVMAMLLVDHGPWNKPHLHTALINYGTTSAAANAAGARVTPTTPKPAIEPKAPGPRPAQPANDVAP